MVQKKELNNPFDAVRIVSSFFKEVKSSLLKGNEVDLDFFSCSDGRYYEYGQLLLARTNRKKQGFACDLQGNNKITFEKLKEGKITLIHQNYKCPFIKNMHIKSLVDFNIELASIPVEDYHKFEDRR